MASINRSISSTVEWAKNALSGDLGRSLFTNEAVSELISQRIGVTVQLGLSWRLCSPS